MNDLRRDLAPIADEAWGAIEEEAKRTLSTYLAGRKLVDFHGPLGWQASARDLGRVRRIEGAGDGVEARQRVVLPLVELRVPFALEREELDAIVRGAADPNLAPVVDGARLMALAEDRLVFQGLATAGITGLVPSVKSLPVKGAADLVCTISDALEVLREAGVAGPYAVALGPRWYTEVTRLAAPADRYPLAELLRRLIDGPIVWAPALAGGLVVSLRGGDFELTCGRDLSIGYLDHDASKVRLYFEESLTFRVLTPEAAVALVP